MESYRFLAGPVSEDATEIKVYVAFTREWFPSTAHWVCSPVVKVVKSEQNYFPETRRQPRNPRQPSNGIRDALESSSGPTTWTMQTPLPKGILPVSPV